jgi:predicted Zn-dependent protease
VRLALAAGAAALAAVLVTSAQQAAPQDALLRAMHDEIERARKLTVAGLEAPYFIQYVVDESENFSVSASLGGILARQRDHYRAPAVRVRVGDYKFDDGNYVGSGIPFGTRYDMGRFPSEDLYPVLRRYLWLATDSAYKSSVEAIARKRAAMRNVTQSEPLHDLSHAEPVHYLRDFSRLSIDEDTWTGRVRALSALFAKFPELRYSQVDLESSAGGYYVVNSEGTEVRAPENVTFLRVRAMAQAPDGMTERDAVTFHAFDPMRMPGDAELTRGVEALAGNVTALARAPLGEDYSGPVLFEGMAGAQIFAEVLGRNLAPARRPVMEPGRGNAPPPGELEGRLGARVLPDSFDVVDDPSQKEWRGRPLFGSYDVDREGVPAKPLRLVEKGVLKNYLLTRQPVRGFEGSNGRARLPGAFGADAAGFGNLFVSSSETSPVGELKKKLIEIAKARGKSYGILIRKMDFPSSAAFDEVRRLLSGGENSEYPVSLPILAYKVYPDGREELVRGLRFRNFTTRSLRDILAAGDDGNVFEFMDNTAPFALIGGSSFTSEASVVAPSVLIDDLDLHPLEGDYPKPPIVPPPALAP